MPSFATVLQWHSSAVLQAAQIWMAGGHAAHLAMSHAGSQLLTPMWCLGVFVLSSFLAKLKVCALLKSVKRRRHYHSMVEHTAAACGC